MKVNTGELERQASQLQTVAGKLNDIQDSVLRIARNLSRQQFGERFRYPLNSAASSIGRRSDELKRMRTALRQIAQLYERTEMNITDEAEHASVHHQQSGIGSVSIPGIGIGLVENILDRNYPTRPVERNDYIPVPGAVPVAIVPVLRDLISRWQDRNRGRGESPIERAIDHLEEVIRRDESPIERAIDQLEEILRDQYGGDAASRREHLREILNELTEHLDDTDAHPDLDSIVEDVARIGRESIRDAFGDIQDDIIVIDGPDIDPIGESIPEGFVDAFRDAISNDGNSGYVPPHTRVPDLPPINPSDIFDRTYFDNTPPAPGNIADFIADGGVQINERIFQPLGPGSQAPTAADMISNAADTIADAISNAGSGLEGRPIASLDPVGPGIADGIISTIDGAISSIADSVPNLGEDIAGGVGNIDWTPWNP